MRTLFPLICAVLLLCNSCMKDDEFWDRFGPGAGGSAGGVFIVNEGNFMYGNASLSFYDPETGEVHNNVFYSASGLPLGDVAQSMAVRDSLGYVVVNNSGKVQVISIHHFGSKGKITGLTSPRYLHFISDTKAYVTDLYAGSVAVVNPEAFTVTGSVDLTGAGAGRGVRSTEQMVQSGPFVFISCWSFDDRLLVIDTRSDRVVDSIRVLKQPNSMAVDRFGKIWVLTDGGVEGSPFGHERAGLIRIDASTRAIEEILRFAPGDSPSELQINGSADTLYFINRDVFRMAARPGKVPELFIESPYSGDYPGGFYGLGIDPHSSEIYVADAVDFVQPGWVYRFRPDGEPSDTFRVGIAPGSFCFKPSAETP